MSEEIQVEGEELPHLLLVDDDATFTRVMARAMSRRGFRVSTAGSAEEGLTLAQQDDPAADSARRGLRRPGHQALAQPHAAAHRARGDQPYCRHPGARRVRGDQQLFRSATPGR